jgi:hypothetical protein
VRACARARARVCVCVCVCVCVWRKPSRLRSWVLERSREMWSRAGQS